MIFVRTDDGTARACAPHDLEGAVRAETPVARDPAGPFVPLARAAMQDGELRDALARALPTVPSLRDGRRVRLAIAVLALLPVALLAFIDARVAFGAGASAARSFVVDVLLVAFVVHELLRPTPRLPAVGAIALASIALRWCLLGTRLCDTGLPWYVWLAPAAAACAALLFAARVPSASRVALELLDKLGVSPGAARAATRPTPPSGRLVGAALVAAVGLPLALQALRSAAASLAVQASVFVVYALVVPLVARRFDAREAAAPRTTTPAAVLWGVFAGLVVTSAIMTGARAFVDTGTELARCFGKLDAEARRLAAREAEELSRAVVRVRASPATFALAAVVFPFAEERIYRGLLQDTLVRKYGVSYGLFASAVVFGFAHVGVYQVGLYQTVLLGVAFGIAYLEGGIVAAVVVHAGWNLLMLI